MAKTNTKSPSIRCASKVDQHVGMRIREGRKLLGLSLRQLAELIGVTYQQFHEYEDSSSRVSAGRLHEIAQALCLPIDYFFDGLDLQQTCALTTCQRKCLEFVQSFSSITNEKHQDLVARLAQALATVDE